MSERNISPSDNLSLEETDRRAVFHPNTVLGAFERGELGDPTIITGADGIRIRDQKGRSYIDAFAALWCVNIGYGRTEIADALAAQARQLAYYHAHAGHSSEPVIRLSDRVIRMAPAGMSHVFWGLQGSDAHETQVKMTWYYNNARNLPNKKKIISRRRAYHGLTIVSASLSGLPNYHKAFDLPLGPIRHTMAPYYYWRDDPAMTEAEYARYCADQLDALIEAEGPETVAAFIGEPVMGVGGILPPPADYWQQIQRVLAKHDVLLMSDEVVCGFGRLGANFGATLYGMQPDMMAISKGLTSGYFPLAGSIVGERVWREIQAASDRLGPYAHGFTYAAHPLGAAVALTNLDIIERERLIDNARTTGAYLNRRLAEVFAGHDMVGEVRGVGLLACVEFVADRVRRTRFDAALKVGQRIAAACRERGLIVRPLPEGDMLGFSPPLIVKPADIDEMVAISHAAVAAVADQLVAEGAWRPPAKVRSPR
ncbi:MAG: aminotransferase class III-fold pyridoxal phosphate-dependent enzyme [Alphaproteobacteria bacterium]|nr:aminotransferase class III-fold pyridoxal phosphate-dependent enzyme [Alphaproteobacteria bacterium]MBM3733934.1 aminotransferase class III-fold pyridoxal phosphate-dependent enzyme [Acidimicrobiia bacterium]